MAVIEDSVQNVVPQQKFARTDGARVIRGSLSQRKIRVSGSILGPNSPIGGVSNFRTELDNMRNALHANAPAVMYTQYDDRYLVNVSCQNIPLLFDSNGYDRRAKIDIDFIAGDPFYYAVALSNDTWLPVATGESRSITPGGLEPVLPTFYITAGVSGTAAWTILNSTTGVSFTIAGAVVAGDTVVVDCLNQTVTISGVDRMSYFDGRWISLAANVAADMRIAYTGSPTITRVQTQWRNRWI
jgi:hypothetical protein